PGGLQPLLNRAPKDVPPRLIRAFTRLGLSYARDFARTTSEAERIRLFLRVNERFCRWVVDQDWGQAGGIFVYNNAALEILREARRRGLRAVVEQTIAPFAYERQILTEERERYPIWEPDLGHVPEFDQYADRE